ncbi:hypothetical protein ONE63_002060 [Megalurothrips usitatus]|uniref:Uncharacterized protein n=1 Tax=Megalurothrips usitatus TaxID=439358 RepID=A0AAV7XA85_9NEOP|nr:hypothetical protein ONE63_002060 [Megalurothrips usitatus]
MALWLSAAVLAGVAGSVLRDIDPLASCPSSNLVCDGGRCVHYTYQCDGDLDCVDGADERGCPERCAAGYFRCDRTRCIVEAFRCDGDADCTDGADERGCSACNDGGFHCDGSRCIDSDRLCDGRQDCDDGADERSCSQCPEERFQCDGQRCLPAEERCDGVPQCRDAADEANCTECSDTARMCAPGRCVPSQTSCDAKPDCINDADHPACLVAAGLDEDDPGNGGAQDADGGVPSTGPGVYRDRRSQQSQSRGPDPGAATSAYKWPPPAGAFFLINFTALSSSGPRSWRSCDARGDAEPQHCGLFPHTAVAALSLSLSHSSGCSIRERQRGPRRQGSVRSGCTAEPSSHADRADRADGLTDWTGLDHDNPSRY